MATKLEWYEVSPPDPDVLWRVAEPHLVKLLGVPLETLRESRDLSLEAAWGRFDIPINDEEEIEEDFLHFEAGTSRYTVWEWFDSVHSRGLVYMMFGEQHDKNEDD